MEDIKDFNAVIEGVHLRATCCWAMALAWGVMGFGFGEIRETLKKSGPRALFDEFKDENPGKSYALENAEQVLKALRVPECGDRDR